MADWRTPRRHFRRVRVPLGIWQSQVVYTTAAVERGDIETTVVAAGVVQPINYVDVGAQTSGKLKSLKVKRGDQVEKDQLLAEIDPALADTALTASNAALQNMTSQRALKQAQSVEVLFPAPKGRNLTLTENAASPFHAEPGQNTPDAFRAWLRLGGLWLPRPWPKDTNLKCDCHGLPRKTDVPTCRSPP